MNILKKFDLYIENQLSKTEKEEFEKELLSQPGLAESFKSYLSFTQLMSLELKSPILLFDNDPIIDELSLSQRLEIEDDIYLHYEAKNSEPEGNILPGNGENDISHDPGDGEKLNELQDASGAYAETDDPGMKDHRKIRKINQLIPYLKVAAAIFIAFFSVKILSNLDFGLRGELSLKQVYSKFYIADGDKELSNMDKIDFRVKGALLEYKRSNQGYDAIYSNRYKVSDKDYIFSLLNLGLINMEKGNYSHARATFKKIQSFEDPFKENSVSYYLALTYLAEEDLSQAIPILNSLAETRNPYRRYARKILNRLKQD